MLALQAPAYRKNTLDHVLLRDVPKPVPGPGQVLVRLHAAAINPADVHIAQGELAMMSRVKPPLTLGVDGCGVVEAAGPGVTVWAPGAEVFFYTGLVHSGTLAQYALCEQVMLAPRPAGWDHATAAAAPLALLVAHKALERGNVTRGSVVLVHGAGGTVGAATVALARHRGAVVHGTGSGADAAYVASLGAARFLDYRQTPLREVKDRYDMVLEGFGGEVLNASVGLARRGGTVVSLKAMTGLEDLRAMGMRPPALVGWLLPVMFRQPLRAARRAGVRLVGLASFQDGPALAQAVQLAQAAGYAPRVERTFPLERAVEALRHFHTSSPRGKVVVTMA